MTGDMKNLDNLHTSAFEKVTTGLQFVSLLKIFSMINGDFKAILSKIDLSYESCPKDSVSMNMLLTLCAEHDIIHDFQDNMRCAIMDENLDVVYELSKFGITLNMAKMGQSSLFYMMAKDNVSKDMLDSSIYLMNSIEPEKYDLSKNTILSVHKNFDNISKTLTIDKMITSYIESKTDYDREEIMDMFCLMIKSLKLGDITRRFDAITFSSSPNQVNRKYFNSCIYTIFGNNKINIKVNNQKIISTARPRTKANKSPLSWRMQPNNNMKNILVNIDGTGYYLPVKDVEIKNSDVMKSFISDKIIDFSKIVEKHDLSSYFYEIDWFLYLFIRQDYDYFLKAFDFRRLDMLMNLINFFEPINDMKKQFIDSIVSNISIVNNNTIFNGIEKNYYGSRFYLYLSR